MHMHPHWNSLERLTLRKLCHGSVIFSMDFGSMIKRHRSLAIMYARDMVPLGVVLQFGPSELQKLETNSALL